MTELTTNVLNQVFDAAKDYNEIEIVIALLQKDENQEAIASYLNNNLQVASTRNLTFRFINELFQYFTYDIIKSNAIIWLSKCLELKVAYKREHFCLICKLLKCLDQEQEFRKYVVTNCVSKIVDQCLVMNSYANNLECLELLLVKYSNTCFPWKLKIEEFLFNTLTSTDVNNTLFIKQCGRCLHFLQQVGGGGLDGITHKTNWSTTVKRLCSTIHNLYDTLFETITELNDHETVNMESYKLPDIPSSTNSIEHLSIVTNRLNNLLIYLQTFLESRYTVAKNLQPEMILDLIKRGLANHNCFATDSQFINKFALKDNVIKMQINILRLFRSFIACLHNNAVPYTTQVTKLLLDTLLRTKKCKCYNPYDKYIANIYKVFIYWIVLMKNKIDTSCHNKLITFIIEQIKPEKSCLQLTIQPSARKKSTKKSKPIVPDANLNLAKRTAHFNSITSEINCLNALKLLDNFLTYVSIRIGYEKFMELYGIVTSTLTNIQNGNNELPYTNIKCELFLYRILLSLFEQPFTIYSPPFDLSLNIFLNGQESRNNDIALTCFKGVNLIEKFSQAIYPTLYTSNSLNNRIHNVQNNGNTSNQMDIVDEQDVEEEEEEETTRTSNRNIVDSLSNNKINTKRNSNSIENLINGTNKKIKSNHVDEENEIYITSSSFNNDTSICIVEDEERGPLVTIDVEETSVNKSNTVIKTNSISKFNSIDETNTDDVCIVETTTSITDNNVFDSTVSDRQLDVNKGILLTTGKKNEENVVIVIEDDDMLNSFNDVLAN